MSDFLEFTRTRRTGGLAIVVAYLSIVIVYSIFGFNVLQSDVLGYWQDSLNWQTPFHPFHVPGFPLLIAFARFVSFSSLSPQLYMQLISLSSFVFCIFFIYRLSIRITESPELAMIAVLLFSLWPFVGLTYVAYPLADSLAMALFLAGLLAFMESRTMSGSILLGLTLVVHKAMWVFVVFCFIGWIIQNREIPIKKIIGMLGLIGLPISILWIAGAIYHQSAFWIVASNYSVELDSKSSLPILDGLLGTILSGGMRAWVKGGTVTFMSAGSLLLMFYSFMIKYKNWNIGFAIACSVFLLTVVLNQGEIWAAVRFGRLLALPIVWAMSSIITLASLQLKSNRILISIIITLCYISQLFYAWYLVNYFS